MSIVVNRKGRYRATIALGRRINLEEREEIKLVPRAGLETASNRGRGSPGFRALSSVYGFVNRGGTEMRFGGRPETPTQRAGAPWGWHGQTSRVTA